MHLLGIIKDYVSLPLSQPSYVNIDKQGVSEAFVGYRMRPGEPLWTESLLTLKDAQSIENNRTIVIEFPQGAASYSS